MLASVVVVFALWAINPRQLLATEDDPSGDALAPGVITPIKGYRC